MRHSEIEPSQPVWSDVGIFVLVPDIGEKSRRQHFDVYTMPYRLDDYTKYIYPLKMHEYLASGRPVVSARICSVEEFNHVVDIARQDEDCSNLIERALSGEESAPARHGDRHRVAREDDWEVLVAQIARTIAERLGIPPRSALLSSNRRSTANLVQVT